MQNLFLKSFNINSKIFFQFLIFFFKNSGNILLKNKIKTFLYIFLRKKVNEKYLNFSLKRSILVFKAIPKFYVKKYEKKNLKFNFRFTYKNKTSIKEFKNNLKKINIKTKKHRRTLKKNLKLIFRKTFLILKGQNIVNNIIESNKIYQNNIVLDKNSNSRRTRVESGKIINKRINFGKINLNKKNNKRKYQKININFIIYFLKFYSLLCKKNFSFDWEILFYKEKLNLKLYLETKLKYFIIINLKNKYSLEFLDFFYNNIIDETYYNNMFYRKYITNLPTINNLIFQENNYIINLKSSIWKFFLKNFSYFYNEKNYKNLRKISKNNRSFNNKIFKNNFFLLENLIIKNIKKKLKYKEYFFNNSNNFSFLIEKNLNFFYYKIIAQQYNIFFYKTFFIKFYNQFFLENMIYLPFIKEFIQNSNNEKNQLVNNNNLKLYFNNLKQVGQLKFNIKNYYINYYYFSILNNKNIKKDNLITIYFLDNKIQNLKYKIEEELFNQIKIYKNLYYRKQLIDYFFFFFVKN